MKKTTKIFGLLLTLFGLALVTGCTPITDTPYVPEETTYTVTIASGIKNGTVSTDKTSAKAGETVKLTAIPDSGYELDTFYVNDNAITGGTFTMPAENVTVSATFKETAETRSRKEVEAVIAEIDIIGTVEYTVESKTLIDNARAAYNALTDEQKDLVTNYETLTTAESRYSELKTIADNQVAAADVITKISAIGTVEYTDICKAKIDEARAAYDALTEAQKVLVTNYSILTTAESRYSELRTAAANQAAATGVIAKINAIDTVIYTDACKALIDAARNAYNALTSDQKALVTNYSILTDAESVYTSLIPREYTIKFYCKFEGEVTEFSDESDMRVRDTILDYLKKLETLKFTSNDMLVISDLDKTAKLQIIFNNVANCYILGNDYTVSELEGYAFKYSLISSESGYTDSSEIILTYECQVSTQCVAAFN